MVVRRMSQRYWANQEERAAAAVSSAGASPSGATGAAVGSIASKVADNDKAMLDLQRRVEGEYVEAVCVSHMQRKVIFVYSLWNREGSAIKLCPSISGS